MLILKGHKGPIYEIDFSPDGTKLASAGGDGTARLWDLLEGKEITSRDSRCVSSVAFSSDGRTVAIGGTKIQMWNTARNVISQKLNIKGYWLSFACVDFSANGQYLVAIGSCGLVCWQFKRDRWELSWNEPSWASDIGCVTCSPSHPTFASGNILNLENKYNTVDIWSIKSGNHLGSIPERGPHWSSRATSLTYSPDGKILAGTCGRELVVWNASTLKECFTFKSSGTHFQSAAFSPDGLSLGAVNNDNTVRTWETTTWKAGNKYDWEIGKLLDIAYAPDGMRAAACSNTGKIIIWDIVT
jgi:WD40 repeat protein